MIQLKEVPCPVCDGRDYRVLRESTLGDSLPQLGYQFTPEHVKAYRMVKCANCGHVCCSPLPLDLFEHYVDIEDAEYLKGEAQRIATAEKVLKTLRLHKAAGRLLDVGCSTGDFLQVAGKYYEVEGIELSAWAAALARAKGLAIHELPLARFPADGRFDVVTLWGVIEHLENPGREIAQIHRLLRDNGILCIWTGNINSLTARILGEKWWYYMGQHIQYFSDTTLELLLKRCGFSKVTIRSYPYVLSMSAVANSIGRYPSISRLLSPVLKSRMLSTRAVTFALPGEMFAIYRKT